MGHHVSFNEVFLHPIATAMRRGTTIPYQMVKHDPVSYLAKTPLYKVVKKYLHKYFYLLLSGQSKLLTESISSHTRILFIYNGKDSFGDANLELSGRSLLKNQNYTIDLLTLPKLKNQFGEDDIFRKVYTNIEECQPNCYDSIIIAEFNYKSLHTKVKHFRKLPFACLFGYFDGPARNQATFSHAAFNTIFSLGRSDSVIFSESKPYLACSKETSKSIEVHLPRTRFIVFSIGGIDPYRTYGKWNEVIDLLRSKTLSDTPLQILLIGSENGQSCAESLLKSTRGGVAITNLTGKLSLLQTRAVIMNATLFVGCDGGLMHVAHSTDTPSVTLFSRSEPNEYWLTPACKSLPLQSPGCVSEIAPTAVVSNILTVLGPHRPLPT